jgi:hypothetical protein
MSEQQPSAQELTLQDLSAMRSIIQICTERGVFKPNELVPVGLLYNKLDSFLTVVEQQQKAAANIDQEKSKTEDTPNA